MRGFLVGGSWNLTPRVMPALDTGTHVLPKLAVCSAHSQKDVGTRIKSGHDEGGKF
jgi:hypothetical protein